MPTLQEIQNITLCETLQQNFFKQNIFNIFPMNYTAEIKKKKVSNPDRYSAPFPRNEKYLRKLLSITFMR